MAPFLSLQRHNEQGCMVGLAQYQEILRRVQNARMAENSLRYFHTRDELMAYFRDTIGFSHEGMQSLQGGLQRLTPENSISDAIISDADCKRLLERGFYAPSLQVPFLPV
jgi:hypothetical protein